MNHRISNNKFWSHEFLFHGSCAYDLSDISSVKSVDDYFELTIDLMDSNNAGFILERSGIVPGGKYTLQNITDALESYLKVYVNIICKGFKVRNFT